MNLSAGDPIDPLSQPEEQKSINLGDLATQKLSSTRKKNRSLDATRNSLSQDEEQMLREIARDLKRQKSKSRSPPKKEPEPTPVVVKKKAPIKPKVENKPVIIKTESKLDRTTERLYRQAPAIKAKKEAFIREEQDKQLKQV